MNVKQSPNALIMVRPATIRRGSSITGPDTDQEVEETNMYELLRQAQGEFDRMVDILEHHEIDVKVWQDTQHPAKPHAMFPSRWISFHNNGTVVLYPLKAESQRCERRQDIVEALREEFDIHQIIDLSCEEQHGRYLEGTASIVFDHPNKIAYACRSSCTDEGLLKTLCQRLGYKPIVFDALDERGQPVFHSHQILTVGSAFAVVCLDSIRKEADQDILLDQLAASGHKVIAVSYAQTHHFAGNMMEVQTRHGDAGVLLSEQAFQSFLPGQIDAITRFAEMIPIKVDSIEPCGASIGGMMAGIYLPRK